jgi:hypothetical protein
VIARLGTDLLDAGRSGVSMHMDPDARLRVLTLNVYGPSNPDWERRHALLRKTLSQVDADVIALQEVPVNDSAFLDDLVGPGFHFAHFSRPSADGVAGTLATRWPGDDPTMPDADLPWAGSVPEAAAEVARDAGRADSPKSAARRQTPPQARVTLFSAPIPAPPSAVPGWWHAASQCRVPLRPSRGGADA